MGRRRAPPENIRDMQSLTLDTGMLEELFCELKADGLATLQDLKTEHGHPLGFCGSKSISSNVIAGESGLKVEFDFAQKVFHESGLVV